MARKKGKAKAKANANGSAISTPRRPQQRARPSKHARQAWALEDGTPPTAPSALPHKLIAEAAALDQFSLKDEARWALNHRSRAFDSGRKLRTLHIDFVSAGHLEGTIKEQMRQPPAPQAPLNSAAMAELSIQCPSPSPSTSSSEDEVVFRGRSATPFTQASAPSTVPTKAAPVLPSREALEATLGVVAEVDVSTKAGTHVTAALTEDTVPQLTISSSVEITPSASDEKEAQTQGHDPTVAESSSDSDGVVVEDGFKKRLGGQSPWMHNTTPWESRSKPGIGWLPMQDRPDMHSFLNGTADPLAAAMDDYMENTRAEFAAEFASKSFAHRDMDLAAGDGWESVPSGMPKATKHDDEWDSDLLRDLDGLSTSSDVIDTVERILSVRTRKNVLQYLVIYEGSTADDAHWLPASFLTTARDLDLIRVFQAENASRDRRPDDDSDSGSDLSDMFIEDDDDDDKEDDEYDDERLAAILQRQEELGLGSSEVVLFGGDEIFDGPASKHTSTTDHFDRPWKKRQHRSKGNRVQPSFPSASAMADALDMEPYGAFDIMDTERPSLRPRKKGRRGPAPPELSDSDLNEQLKATWEADRVKKRFKKAEREELRQQGLLGRKGKAPDLGARYKDGVEMNEIIEEIREFMFSEMQTLSLPPMQSHRRAVVHQVVNQLGVSSKSRGEGTGRFTVLSKTARTEKVDEGFFDAIIHSKKFGARFNAPARGPARKFTRPIVSYKDGETVGATAPELGPENKGRRLLEKMGWTKGTALGAVDNKGILHPITHTVKTGKAGLQ